MDIIRSNAESNILPINMWRKSILYEQTCDTVESFGIHIIDNRQNQLFRQCPTLEALTHLAL